MTHSLIKKDFAKYVSLNVLGMIGLSCYILADTFFVAKALGSLGLAALNFAIPMYSLLNGIGLMAGMGGGAKYTIYKSQGEHKQADIIFTHSIIIAVTTGITIAIIGTLVSSPLADLLGADITTLGITNIYLKTMLAFAPFFILNNVLLAFVRNDNNPRLPMIAMVAGSLANIVLDYIFIFPFDWGMFGAAFATGLSPIISLCILSIHFLTKKNNFKLVKCNIVFKKIGNILGLGISAFITELSSGVVLVTFNLVILTLEGNIGVAAYGVIANFALVIIAIFNGISQGTQPLLSNSYGLGETHRIVQLLRYALTTSFVFSALVYIFSLFGSDLLISVFNGENNMELHDLAAQGIKLYFIGFFFAGINIIITAFFSAIENPKQAFIISIIRGFVGIVPMVFVLSACLKMNGVWLSFTITEAITSLLAIVFLIYYYKNHLRK